jgi:Cu-Zn family superoxide dismutase
MRSTRKAALAGAAFAALLVACGGEQPAPQEAPAMSAAQDTTPAPGAANGASATLADPSGKQVGTAKVTADSTGVAIDLDVTGLAAGPHGVHVHAVGSCEARGDTAFAMAGGHFNPAGKKHGLQNPEGPHAGDTDGLTVGADGHGTAHLTLPGVTLSGGANALLDADGAAIVIHEKADDQNTDPSGASGGRVACGVIQAS